MGELISIREASQLTGYSTEHIRELMREGKISGKKFVTNWMVDRESILEYAKERGRVDNENRGK